MLCRVTEFGIMRLVIKLFITVPLLHLYIHLYYTGCHTSYNDDTNEVQVVHDPSDAILLQKDLNAIYKRAEESNLQFDTEKFQVPPSYQLA